MSSMLIFIDCCHYALLWILIYLALLIMPSAPAAAPYQELISATKYQPCISLIMPFEPKMGLQRELSHRLKLAGEKIERMLAAVYPTEQYQLVLDKFDELLNKLNFNTYKKSIAIFVSPLMEKVYYLDIAVEETIIMDDSFEIRDLIYS